MRSCLKRTAQMVQRCALAQSAQLKLRKPELRTPELRKKTLPLIYRVRAVQHYGPTNY